MPAPASCRVCEHPDRDKIDVALRGTATLRSIERTFAVGRTSLTNHAARHTTAAQTRRFREAAKGGRRRRPVRAVDVKPIESAQDVVEDLQRLRVEAFGLFEQAKGRSDWKSAERIFAQVVAVVDRFGELHRVLGSKGVTFNVDRSTKVLTVLGTLSEDDLRALLARAEAGEPIALEAAGA